MDRQCFIDEYRRQMELGCVPYPQFSSNIIYELEWDDQVKESFVSIRYNGKYYSACEEYEEENVKKSCSLKNFSKFITSRVNPNWEEFCNFGKNSRKFNGIRSQDIIRIEFLFTAIIFMIFFVVIVIIWKWKLN